MAYFVRMIGKKGQWEEDKNKQLKNICSDIITNCLRTSGNTLSLWRIESEDEISEAIIALGSNRDRLQKLDYIVIPAELIEESGFSYKKSPGKSPYVDFNDRHYDITMLDYETLGKVVELILGLLKEPECSIERKGIPAMEEILLDAISKRKIGPKAMKESLVKELGNASLKKSIIA